MDNLVNILKKFGLSEKGAKIYLALLELEAAKVSEVAKYSKVNRSSTYVVLEILRKRGLVGVADDKKIRRYIAASPETLLRTASTLANRQQKIKKDLESAMPQLKALSRDIKRRPIVQVFEGKEGLVNSFEDSLTCKEKLMRVSSSVGNITKLLPEYFMDYLERRKKRGIKMHGIHPANKIATKLVRLDTIKFDTPILIPKSKYKIPADIAIYDDKISYMTAADGGFAIIIQNKELAEVMKNIFDMAYEEAKRLNKDIDKH